MLQVSKIIDGNSCFHKKKLAWVRGVPFSKAVPRRDEAQIETACLTRNSSLPFYFLLLVAELAITALFVDRGLMF